MQAFNIGIKGVIVKDDKVLILKSVNGYWEVPGGRMDEGEDVQDTLRRELGEEIVNIKEIKIHEVLSVFKLKREYKPGMGLMLIFFRVSTDFDDEPIVSEEHTEYKWASVQEAVSLVEEASQEAIRRAHD